MHTKIWSPIAALVATSMLFGGSALAMSHTIKIGVIQPLTGPLAFNGNNDVHGAKLAPQSVQVRHGLGRVVVAAAAVDDRERVGLGSRVHDTWLTAAQHHQVDV